MKQFNIKTMLAAAIMAAGLASCSNSDDLESNNGSAPIEFKLAKTVEMNCSSDDVVLGEWESWYYKVQDYQYTTKEHMPASYALFVDKAPAQGNGEAVTTEEKDKVMAYLAAHPNEGSTEFNHYNYFIQYVGGSYTTYTSEQYPELKDNNGASHSVTGTNHMDYIQFVNQNGETLHINDYNSGYGPRALVLNLKITGANYHDSWGDKDQIKTDKYRFYTIDGNLYLCFDYATAKNSGENFAGDGVYNDYVIKITPACDEPTTPPSPDPETPDPTDPDPEDPETPVVTVNNGHVEVNLAAKDYKDYEASKLSVHVRDTVNFKVFIPVPDQYYCAEDDMYIVEKHYDNMTYNNLSTTMEREIAGQKVTLSITYAAEGIYIESAGINSKVLEYCRNVYGDGLTFEVNNYYNAAITRANLIQALNQSTITFTDRKPKAYINTIIEDNKDAIGNLLDCVVTNLSGLAE